MTKVKRISAGSDTPATQAATLGGPGTIAAAAAATRHLRTPGDRNQTPYDFDADNRLVRRDRYDGFDADRAFGDDLPGGAA